jgi:NAD(P)-dependent dehydrogenase (short-subunit alcohol dehydrogenase family)
MRLEPGQVAVVTGGASGIGRALADAFASRSLHVVVTDVEVEPLRVAAEEIRAANDVDVLDVAVDVTDADAVLRLRDAVLDRFGRVDVLCNNAGVVGPRVPTWQQRPEDWTWVVDVNLWGVVHGLAAFLPAMVEAGRGHIVNTASIAGLTPVPGGGRAPYAASKYAVVGLSETLHVELAEHAPALHVTVLCPGPVATRILEAERNRPASLQVPVLEKASAPQAFASRWPSMAPAEVAQQVLDAIEAEQLFVVPSPETVEDIRARTARLDADLP